MKTVLYWLCQCTWGLPQTLLGLVVFLTRLRDRHYLYHGAVVTEWAGRSSVSLGLFVFVTAEPFFLEKLPQFPREVLSARLLVHEYGHTIQSLLLGPLYLLAMGIPSTLWGFLPSANKLRVEKQVSYFAFFTEKWANALGEWATGEKSMENLVID